MAWKYVFLFAILLTGTVILTGCANSPMATVTTPPPAPATAAAGTPPLGAPSVAAPPPAQAMRTAAAATTVPAPVPDHPYSKTYTFTGTGDFNQEFTTDSDRTWVFRMNDPGVQEIFSVAVLDGNGDPVDMLASADQPFLDSKSLYLKAGTYYLDVVADSPWTVTISTA